MCRNVLYSENEVGRVTILSGFIGDKKPVDLTYLGAQLISNDGGIGNPTFTAFNAGGNGIGAADSTRQIFVAIYTIGTAANSYPVSMTIGGVAATQVTNSFVAAVNIGITIWRASVPTGTTANIAVVWSAANGVRAYAMVYRVLNASTTMFHTATPDSTLSSETLSTSLNITGQGAVISCAMGRASSGAPSFTWGNVTENVESGMGGAYGVFGATAASLTNTASGTITINNTQTGAASTAGSAGLIAISLQPL